MSKAVQWLRNYNLAKVERKNCISSQTVKSLFPFSMLFSFLKFINPNSSLYKEVNTFPSFHHACPSNYSNAAIPFQPFNPCSCLPKTLPFAQNWHDMTAARCVHRQCEHQEVSHTQSTAREKLGKVHLLTLSIQLKSHLLLEAGASHVNNSGAEQARHICRNKECLTDLVTLAPLDAF